MSKKGRGRQIFVSLLSFCVVALLTVVVLSSPAQAFTLHVINGKTNTPMTSKAFRWMVEVDNTFDTVPGAAVTDQLSFAIHNSYAPIATLTDGSPLMAMVPAAQPMFRSAPGAIMSRLCRTAATL